MPIPAAIGLTEDAAFSSIAFFELAPDGRFASVAPEAERVIVGQTVIVRYVKPVETQIQALCGLDEADDLEDAVGDSATLDWHRTNATALLVRADVKRIPELGVAEATLTFIL